MPQTLFRLQVDSAFSTESIDGIPRLGIGWMVVPWAALTLYWIWRAAESETPRTERKALSIQFVIGPVSYTHLTLPTLLLV